MFSQGACSAEALTVVEVDTFVVEVSNINLVLNTFEMTLQTVLRWNKENDRTPNTPATATQQRRLVGTEAEQYLANNWNPSFTIENAKTTRNTLLLEIDEFRNGDVVMAEKFTVTLNFSANLSNYPFVTVTLPVVLQGTTQNSRQAIFISRIFQTDKKIRKDDFIRDNWQLDSLAARSTETTRLTNPEVKYSGITYDLLITHRTLDSFNKIFIPLLFIFICSSALMLLDGIQCPPYLGARVGGIILLMLTTVNIKSSLSRDLPIEEFLTFIDIIFFLVWSLLTLALFATCVIVAVHMKGHTNVCLKLHKGFLTLYPSLCAASLIFLFLWKILNPFGDSS
jgi:hypothetical protein